MIRLRLGDTTKGKLMMKMGKAEIAIKARGKANVMQERAE
jgi:hypothetical protein